MSNIIVVAVVLVVVAWVFRLFLHFYLFQIFFLRFIRFLPFIERFNWVEVVSSAAPVAVAVAVAVAAVAGTLILFCWKLFLNPISLFTVAGRTTKTCCNFLLLLYLVCCCCRSFSCLAPITLMREWKRQGNRDRQGDRHNKRKKRLKNKINAIEMYNKTNLAWIYINLCF